MSKTSIPNKVANALWARAGGCCEHGQETQGGQDLHGRNL